VRGFSLIELLIVIVLFGILVSTAVPGLSQLRITLGHSWAKAQLTQDLRLARQIAVTQRSPVVIAFGDGVMTSGVTTYTLHVDRNGDRIKQASEPVSQKQLFRGVELSLIALQPRDSVIFDISGILFPGTMGGNLVLAGAGQIDTLLVSASGLVYEP
jgi:prepilin-type N-terminal cleavage/methylation domain-containing protein